MVLPLGNRACVHDRKITSNHPDPMPHLSFTAKIPLTIDCPDAMAEAVRYVFEGEYESHHDGAGLDILDVGANVGSFAIWASMRWPGSERS